MDKIINAAIIIITKVHNGIATTIPHVVVRTRAAGFVLF